MSAYLALKCQYSQDRLPECRIEALRLQDSTSKIPLSTKAWSPTAPSPQSDPETYVGLFGTSQRCPAALLHTWVTDHVRSIHVHPRFYGSGASGLVLCQSRNGSCRRYGEGSQYGPRYYAIRTRLHKDLLTGQKSIRTISDDERLKMSLPQACCYCGSKEKLSWPFTGVVASALP